MDSADAAYAAGFFDGEGCVHLSHNKNGTVRCQLVLSNQHKAVMEWIHAQWGGNLYHVVRDNAKRQCYEWRPGSEAALAFLETVIPYLKVKREQAENAVEFLKLRREAKRSPGKRVPLDLRIRMDRLVQRQMEHLRSRAVGSLDDIPEQDDSGVLRLPLEQMDHAG